MDDFERCWMIGEWDGQLCIMCPHNSECGASEDKEADVNE